MTTERDESAIGAELTERLERITAALTTAADRICPEVIAAAHADLDRVSERLDLGVHHTVVALVGGTGSGKSSMFNALTRLDFADVGVIRPTTSQAAACTWGGSADPLLDFLGVDSERRIGRESALTGTDEDHRAGLVLLDLPDHDSVAEGHASLVDRLLPMIDLLIWVLDPQKYADNVLHEKYLRELTHRHEAMLVVVNQVDTVPDAGLDQIHDDVRRLLEADALDDVPILLASAKTGHGINMISDHLNQVMSSESIAARTIRDELTAISRRIAAELAPDTPTPQPAGEVATDLATAAGVPAVAESIHTAVAGAGSAALSAVQPPASSRIEAIREGWLDRVAGAMPLRWREAATGAAMEEEQFYQHVSDAISSVQLPRANDARARRLRLIGLVAAILGVVGGLVAGVLNIGWQWAGIAGGLVLVLGLVVIVLARTMRVRTARRRSADYVADVHAALAQVVTADLQESTAPVLADHDAVLRTVNSR